MASFMIVRLPPEAKSLEAIEYMQKNDFFFRLSSNVPLMESLMSSGGVDSQLSSIISPSEKFELGKEEINITNELTSIFAREIKVEVDINENPPFEERAIKQEDNDFENYHQNYQYSRLETNSIGVQPMAGPRNPPSNAAVDVGQVQDKSFTEIQGDLKPVIEQGPQRALAESEGVLPQREEHEQQNSFGENEDEGDHPANHVDFEEDRRQHETEIMDYSKGNEWRMKDGEKMEESDDKEPADENGHGDAMDEEEDEGSDENEMNSIDVQTEDPVESPMATAKNPSSVDVMQAGQAGDGRFIKIHGDLKPKKRFSCIHCEKSFTTKQNFESHERSHTGEKPFSCNRCDYRSARKCTLKAHNRVHTGERPFECSHCGRKFGDRKTWTQHIRIHTGEKPYACKNCDKIFTRNSTLKKHMKTVHKS